jgi:hypothetical protein
MLAIPATWEAEIGSPLLVTSGNSSHTPILKVTRVKWTWLKL